VRITVIAGDPGRRSRPSKKTVSDGRMAGAVEDLERTAGELQPLAVRAGNTRATGALPPQAADALRRARTGGAVPSRAPGADAVAAASAPPAEARRCVRSSRRSPSTSGASSAEARSPPRPRARSASRPTSPRWFGVLMGEHDPPRAPRRGDRARPVRGSRSVSGRAPSFGPGVEQRPADPRRPDSSFTGPDGERRPDREAVDHPRIRASTSSRRSLHVGLPRTRLSRGSAAAAARCWTRRTLKCPVVVVDRDTVELRDPPRPA